MRFNAPSRRGEALESAFFSFSTAISSLFSPFLSSLLFLFSLTHKQNLIFRFLQSRQTVQIWLYEQADLRIEGLIIVSVSLLLNFHRSRSKRRRQRFLFSTSSLSRPPRSLALSPLRPPTLLRLHLVRLPLSLAHQSTPLSQTPSKRFNQKLHQGFDEYMNMVVDEAEEVSAKRKTRKHLGRILLKGDTISLMRPVTSAAA